tara:strand:- start:2009 stop:2296 length:288 start_codon:yes stop_codon:yes gene_type:complete
LNIPFELAWKTLKDYLLFEGLQLEKKTPRETIKQAFAAGIIKEGKLWIQMLEHRNLMSHVYDKAEFQKTIKSISENYVAVLGQLCHYFKNNEQSI